MNVIFLDIDGVLNNQNYAIWLHDKMHVTTGVYRVFDPKSVQCLNEIMSKVDAKIVISSCWRVLHPYKELGVILEKQGLKNGSELVIGQTPRSNASWVRGDEIQYWMEKSEEKIDHFVIIDDGADMAHLLEFLVQTTWDEGLKEEHIQPILDTLKMENWT